MSWLVFCFYLLCAWIGLLLGTTCFRLLCRPREVKCYDADDPIYGDMVIGWHFAWLPTRAGAESKLIWLHWYPIYRRWMFGDWSGPDSWWDDGDWILRPDTPTPAQYRSDNGMTEGPECQIEGIMEQPEKTVLLLRDFYLGRFESAQRCIAFGWYSRNGSGAFLERYRDLCYRHHQFALYDAALAKIKANEAFKAPPPKFEYPCWVDDTESLMEAMS